MNSLLAPHIAGRPTRWARDFALFGGLTCLGVPLALIAVVPPGYPFVAGVLGALTGGALGLALPFVLERLRGRMPLVLIALMGPILGLVWGGLTGALAGAFYGADSAAFGLLAGGAAGSLQLGWFFFPYLFQSVRSGRTWPLLVGAAVALPLLAIAAYISVVGVLFGSNLMG